MKMANKGALLNPCPPFYRNEEGLAGYSDYKKQVKYKVIPYVW
jgi:hypothetical protein